MKRILIVDDEEGIREILSRVLSAHQLTVLASAEEAVVELMAGKRYDAIITDVDMSPGISGIELIRIARANNLLGGANIFVMTGLPTPERVDFCDEIGAVLLTKPFNIQRFASLVSGV